MSRLIDADALIEVIKESRPLNWTDSESELQEDADYNHFIEMVNAQPTAYDIEKVVAEFEEYPRSLFLKNEHGKVIGRMTTNTININDAIEIVRKGGVE